VLKTLKLLLVLNVFLIPLQPASFGFGYEQIKVFVFLALTVVAGLVFVFLLNAKKIRIRWSKIKIAALVFLGVLSVTSLLGIHPLESLTGEFPYYQGLIL
jgi:hypothetical protein